MADTKISELPVATAIASPDVVPIVQGGVTKQAGVGLFAGLSGAIADQQVAFGNGTDIAGSDDFKWDHDDSSLVFSRNGNPAGDNSGIDIRVPKNFVIAARNNADDDNFMILNKKVTSGHDDLIIGDSAGGHGAITFNGVGNNMTITPAANGSVNITASNGAIILDTSTILGYDTDVRGDLEVQNGGWLAIAPQTRANLISIHLADPFEGIIYTDSSDHHVYYFNGTDFKQFAEVGDAIIFPDSDPHVAGAGYWLAGVLTRSSG